MNVAGRSADSGGEENNQPSLRLVVPPFQTKKGRPDGQPLRRRARRGRSPEPLLTVRDPATAFGCRTSLPAGGATAINACALARSMRVAGRVTGRTARAKESECPCLERECSRRSSRSPRPSGYQPAWLARLS